MHLQLSWLQKNPSSTVEKRRSLLVNRASVNRSQRHRRPVRGSSIRDNLHRRYLLIKTRHYPGSDREFAANSTSTTFTSCSFSLSAFRPGDVRQPCANALDFISGTYSRFLKKKKKKGNLLNLKSAPLERYLRSSIIQNPVQERFSLKMRVQCVYLWLKIAVLKEMSNVLGNTYRDHSESF